MLSINLTSVHLSDQIRTKSWLGPNSNQSQKFWINQRRLYFGAGKGGGGGGRVGGEEEEEEGDE